MVPAEGIEPPTFGLQNRCSTAELSRRRVRLFSGEITYNQRTVLRSLWRRDDPVLRRVKRIVSAGRRAGRRCSYYRSWFSARRAACAGGGSYRRRVLDRGAPQRGRRYRQAWLTWGLGHTLTLFVFAGAAILLGHAIPEKLARPLETAVGVMLVDLGAHVLWRLWRDRVHFHRHSHDGGVVHFHAHLWV